MASLFCMFLLQEALEEHRTDGHLSACTGKALLVWPEGSKVCYEHPYCDCINPQTPCY